MRNIILILVFLAIKNISIGQSTEDYDVYWKKSLVAESKTGNFKIAFGGRIQTDLMFIDQSNSLDNLFEAKNGVEFRRARIYTSGTLYKNVKFKFQLDFAGANVVIKDAYLHFTNIPYLGNIKVGNFKEPEGLAMLTSSNNLTMMERPLGNVFDNDRNIGVMLNNQLMDKHLSWYAGAFYPTVNTGKYLGNKYNIVLRLAGLPIYNTESKYKVLHLGFGYVYQYNDYENLNYSVRPEAHLAPKYLKVSLPSVRNIQDMNTEFLFVYNSFSIESEYTRALITRDNDSVFSQTSYNAFSYNVTLSWFATGEHKNYVKSKTTFGIVKPKKNLGDDGGFGALEFALRYSQINMDDSDLNGGVISDLTAGINWYLNPATRVMFNYIYSDIKNLGNANIFQVRVQIVF
ncbi:MAG: porin [Bacteroidales bacterium]|jgi:phosphate-selective porin OprO/OprP|nr:porin [Bacteroidales bacterium]MDG2080886.1 porin [Bacteroidales bacterium]